jgi:hypothetical protein
LSGGVNVIVHPTSPFLALEVVARAYSEMSFRRCSRLTQLGRSWSGCHRRHLSSSLSTISPSAVSSFGLFRSSPPSSLPSQSTLPTHPCRSFSSSSIDPVGNLTDDQQEVHTHSFHPLHSTLHPSPLPLSPLSPLLPFLSSVKPSASGPPPKSLPSPPTSIAPTTSLLTSGARWAQWVSSVQPLQSSTVGQA